MTHIGIVKADTLVSIINWFGLPLFFMYLMSMFFVPFLSGNWTHTQEIWDRWQTLNVGVLAFISSVIAFNISRYNASKQRERNFIAARAFLPNALSELTWYCKSSSILMLEAWSQLGDSISKGSPLKTTFPDLPQSYKETFKHCISEADPEVASNLADILVKLQIHHSRLNELKTSFEGNGGLIWDRQILTSYLFSLGHLQALINKLFGFSRGMEPFNDLSLIWDDYQNAYSNLAIDIEDVPDLEGFTKRFISRRTNKTTD